MPSSMRLLLICCYHYAGAGAAALLGAKLRPPLAARSSVHFEMLERSQLAELSTLIQQLADDGVTRSEMTAAVESAMVVAYLPKPPPPPPPALGELRAPKTPTDGHAAFREAYTGKLITSQTQKFLNAVIEDRACVFKFRYTRIYALGLTALCDAFLGATCINADEVAATKRALCFGLGLDQQRLEDDARALRVLADGAMPGELFTTPDFRELEESGGSFKYTYAFGVGLVLLMQSTGERDLRAPGRSYGATGAVSDGVIGRWCKHLGLGFARTLERDTERPLNIDGVGRFSFTAESGIEKPPPPTGSDAGAR